MYRVSFIYDGSIITDCKVSNYDDAVIVAESYCNLAKELVFDSDSCDIRVADLETYKIIKQY